jgi:hypothetical protein
MRISKIVLLAAVLYSLTIGLGTRVIARFMQQPFRFPFTQ